MRHFHGESYISLDQGILEWERGTGDQIWWAHNPSEELLERCIEIAEEDSLSDQEWYDRPIQGKTLDGHSGYLRSWLMDHLGESNQI